MSTTSKSQEPTTLPPFRPPAVPLVVCDPYFSVWSAADKLTDAWPTHWTGANHGLCGIARIDGKPYRFMGMMPKDAPAMEQQSLEVLPTRTIYVFEAAGVRLRVTFTTPLLPSDLDVLARPLTYITFEATSADDNRHAVSLYFDASAELAVNTPAQKVGWSRFKAEGLQVLRVGSAEQPMLEKRGDDLRIDWGYLYLAVPEDRNADTVAMGHEARTQFAETGRLATSDDMRMPRHVVDNWPVLACALDLGTVAHAAVSRYVMLAYDDLFSLEYMDRRLRPYWRRNGIEASGLLAAGANDYAALVKKCEAFDAEVMADLRNAGGEAYARLAALAYRQCIAAHKLAADFDGSVIFFSKENFSNGCINTVDLTYPSSPFFLLFNTTLLKGQLTPIMDYASSPRWKFPFAPHDLGTYPLANGQVYGGGERTEENQMPVEESGNMLTMMAALAHVEGNADYALKYWPLLTTWANYLRDKGMDPENQLCTDDFAGHLAHNTNLSLKAIVALRGFAMVAEMAGKTEQAAEFSKIASDMAAKWVQNAADGDHYRLTFDQPGTWSQKYNMVWDKLLSWGLFPAEVARKEIAYYLKQQNRHGLPLDNRSKYTKLDWTVWTAAMAETREDFEALVRPLYDFANETPDQVPLTDWFWTHDAKVVGFRARSVVGGIFIPLLKDAALWKKWHARGGK